ncbi:unnamed protein product [Prorocentrum cordatum]|nr:unnamed protein product [Polarella glacialis]
MLPPGYSMFPALGPSPRARSASSPEGSGGEWAGAGGQPDAEPGAAPPPASEATEAAVAGLPGEGQWVWFPAGGDAPRAEWGGECQGDWPPARHSRRRSGLRAKTREWYPNRSSKLTSRVVAVLESAPPRLAHSTAPDGWVPINAVFAADTELAELCYGNPQQLVLAIRKCPESCHYLVADRDREAVRLLSGAERICMLCETYVLERVKWVPGPAPFLELLQHPPVQSLLATVGEGAATPSDSDYDASVGIVHVALADSTLLELVADESGEWSVALLPLWRPLRVVLEHILESDKKILSTLQREGEVSLAYLAETPAVRKMLKRLELNDTHSALSCLRDATQELKGAQLDASGMSLVPLEAIPDVGLKAWEKRRRERPSRSSWSKWHPEEKDVKKLRDLFAFYFDAFNLQHNKVLMARVEAVREMDAWRAKNPKSRGTRPFFRVSDMQALPRIAAVLNSYDQEGLGWLLEAVFQSSDSLPVRLSWKQGRQSREQPVLELSYTPCFRYFDFVERSPETEFLLDPEPIAGPSSQLAPSHVVCAISYSVSSDLSHAQSPKVTEIQEQIMNGQVDSGVLAWEERQRKLVRQLKLHGADVICIQGVQSIGFKERSSEKDPEWFACDDEPATNHLVHLYRDMNRSNYSVVFSPTMHMPSSSALCLGNAIFWKRNRWHAERVWAITQTAVVVELVSKAECPPLTVCSYKPPEVWAQDWGEELLVADLLKPAERVRAALDPAVAERGSRLLWCGDFGLEPRELLPPLVQQAPPHGDPPEVGTVRSACESVVGWSPWTSACKHSEGKATDLILYDHGLRALAALGGLPDRMDLAKLLRAGNPSDHLVQVAAFSCAGGGRGAHSRCAQEEAPAEAALRGHWPELQGQAGAAFQ